MRLQIVQPQFIDFAWRDGASCLAEACKLVDEITGDQLKLILSRGERTLVKMMDGENTVGWGCFRIDQLPNMRVFHVTDLVAHNAHFETFVDELRLIKDAYGCSKIRLAAPPAQARLYKHKLGAKHVYEILEIE